MLLSLMSRRSVLYTMLFPLMTSSYSIRKWVASSNWQTSYKNMAFLFLDHLARSHKNPEVRITPNMNRTSFKVDFLRGRALLIEGSDV